MALMTSPLPAPTHDRVWERQFVFIIGAPRSGTTWLQALVGSHPLVCTSVEMTLFDCYIGPWLKRWEEEERAIRDGRWHQGLPVLWERHEFDAFVREFLARVYERVLDANPDATHILDKHPEYAQHVRSIERFVPQPRFIHIVRDGRDVASSMIAARKSMGFGTETIAESAAEWKRLVNAAREAEATDKRYLEIRYEDLKAAPETVMSRVFEFAQLPIDSDVLAQLIADCRFEKMQAERRTTVPGITAPEAHYRRGLVGGWRSEFSLWDRYVFDQAAGDLLVSLGYGTTGWWAHSWRDRCVIRARQCLAGLNEHRRRLLRVLAR